MERRHHRPLSNALSLRTEIASRCQARWVPAAKSPPPVVTQNLGGENLGPGIAKVSTLEDGAKVVRYTQPQKLTRLLKDAKANIGGEDSRFYGKGWVIGDQIAKIAADGMSVIYYPQDISDLVRDLLGPDSETL